MDTTILGVYLLFSVIFLDFVFACLIGQGLKTKDPGELSIGIIGCLIVTASFCFSLSEYREPKAIEVYQGKTTLEYTIKDGVKTDSVVVYKNESKRD